MLIIKNTIKELIIALEENIKPEGLGLKKLRDSIWEIRGTLSIRILFLTMPGEMRLLIVGDHNTIHQYLKNHI